MFAAPVVLDKVNIASDSLAKYSGNLSVGGQSRKITLTAIWANSIIVQAGVICYATYTKRVAVGANNRGHMCAVPVAVVTNATGVTAKVTAQNRTASKFSVAAVNPCINHCHWEVLPCVSLVI